MLSLQEHPTQASSQIAELSAQLEQLITQQHARDVRIQLLSEENRWLKQQLFGRSSEQQPAEDVPGQQQRLIFNEAEVLAELTPTFAESIVIPEHDRKKRGRKALPRNLPRSEVIYDLSETDKRCANAHCVAHGQAMQLIGQETSEQLDYVPAIVRVLQHIRLKYACPCCKQSIKLACAAPQVLPKSNATPSLLAHIVTAKYVDGTPLYRQEAQFKRLGLEIPRATSANWIIKLATAVQPLINLLHEHCMAQPLIHMDETTLQVLKSDKSPSADHYLWVSCAGPPQQRSVLFDYDPSRGASVPKRLLQDYRGLLLSDGYEAYDAALHVCNATERRITHAACFAHVRRKFDEAMKAAANRHSQAKTALDFIGQLYGIERQLKLQRESRAARGESLSADEILIARAQHSAPLLAQFKAWLEHLAPRCSTRARSARRSITP